MAIDKSDYRQVFAAVFVQAENLLRDAVCHPDALKHYLESWQEVAKQAAELNNPALQDVVSLFIDAIDYVFKTRATFDCLTDAHWQLLKKWNSLFADYINAPDDQPSALALIQCLNNPLLAMDLSSEDEKVLLESFLPVIKQLSTIAIEDSQQQLSVWEKLTVLQTETDNIFQKLLKQNNQDSDKEYPETVKQYLESWKLVAELIEAEQNDLPLIKILDIISLLIEFSCQLFNQTEWLNSDQQAALKQWHNLFASYIKVKGSQQLAVALVRLLTKSVWMQPLSVDDEKMLLSEFQTQNIPSLELSSSQPIGEEESVESAVALAGFFQSLDNTDVTDEITAIVTEKEALTEEDNSRQPVANFSEIADSVTTEQNNLLSSAPLQTFNHSDVETAVEESDNIEVEAVLQQPEVTKKLFPWQQLERYFNETVPPIKAAAEQQSGNDKVGLKNSLQKYLENWLALAQQIEMNGEQLGLLDVVLLYIEVSRQTFEHLEGFEKKHITLLNKWQSLFGSYLKAKGNWQLAISLIKCLRDPLWQGAIEAEDEEMLLVGFTPPPALQPKIEPTLPLVEQITAKNETTVISAIVAEQSDNAPLSDIGEASGEIAEENPVEKTVFVSQDEKYLIWQTLQADFNQAVTILQAAIDSEIINDMEAFKLGLQSYVERWQMISKIIAADGRLTGLSDVTSLFVDISKQTFAQLSSLNSEQFALLNNWHCNFSGFFKAHHQNRFAIALVKCLESRLWVEPVEAEDEVMLLEEFGITGNELYVPPQVEKNPLWQKIAIVFDDTQSQLPIMQNLLAANTSQACRSCFQQYAQHWLMIAEIIAEQSESLHTLADMTFLFADNCVELLAHNDALTQSHIQLFQAWNAAFVVCLQDDSTVTQIGTLITCLENTLWSRPLTAMDKEMLLAMLSEQSQDFALFAEEDYEQSVILTETEALVTETESDITEELGQESSRFADKEQQANVDEDFAVFAEDETTQSISVNPELIGMVRDEFDLLVKEFNFEINETVEEDAFKEVLKKHVFKLESLAKACNTIGLLGLEQIFEHLSFNMRCRRDIDTFSERQSQLFKATLPLIQAYLAAITQHDKVVALVTHLSAEGWKQPLTESQVRSLIKLLTGLVLSSHNQQLGNRKTQAEFSDISLELPDDVNSELLDSLLNELPVLTNNFSAVIQQIISDDRDLPQLLEAQRIAHTLKGSGNIVGVTGIVVLTHHLEEILEYLSKHEAFPTKALGKVLLESADCLEMMSDLMLNDESAPPEQALQVLQNVLNWANQIAAAGLPTEDNEVETTTLPVQPDTDTTLVVKETKSVEVIAMTRVPSEKIDQLLRMTGEGNILNEQFKERIKRFSEELKALNDLTWQMQSLVSELDQAINIQSYSSKSSRNGIDSEFDALELEQYNELHTAASRISEVATDIRETNIHMDQQLVDLKYLMIEEDAIQKENQELVQSIRMVPASTISSRCQRIVRQACRATNKEVDLEIKGADILIDSEILNDMVDPLMHLLRNSIDHGIEPLHIREKFNKPKTGKITLEFSRKGNYAVITCKDDGGGLASGNILQTAIKKGLISAKQQLTEAEIHKLILIPGFSTRAVVTQTSGRGIGMDAIQTKISSIQGQMSLFSARNKGLTIEITIPLTLSSMLSLLVKCGGQTMAISNRGLRKIHHADECTVVLEEEQLYCEIDYKRYLGTYFSELVGMPITYSAEQKLQALRIEDEIGRTHIVFVEELLGYRDLLVKNMGSYIPHIQGITGASILGNGDVAPVIDLVEMLHHAAKYDYVLADASKALAESINGLPVALVVDDSLSARRAVAMLLKDSGLDVETAIDGLDALKKIEKTVPDIILVDLEMPRMNGIELTAHVRGREDMKNVPIIMVTSRATEKHRKQAEAAGVTKFMTKPFTEDDLIHNVRILMN